MRNYLIRGSANLRPTPADTTAGCFGVRVHGHWIILTIAHRQILVTSAKGMIKVSVFSSSIITLHYSILSHADLEHRKSPLALNLEVLLGSIDNDCENGGLPESKGV
jgi:hypothetical protein